MPGFTWPRLTASIFHSRKRCSMISLRYQILQGRGGKSPRHEIDRKIRISGARWAESRINSEPLAGGCPVKFDGVSWHPLRGSPGHRSIWRNLLPWLVVRECSSRGCHVGCSRLACSSRKSIDQMPRLVFQRGFSLPQLNLADHLSLASKGGFADHLKTGLECGFQEIPF